VIGKEAHFQCHKPFGDAGGLYLRRVDVDEVESGLQ
jgi:hypothetical protein